MLKSKIIHMFYKKIINNYHYIMSIWNKFLCSLFGHLEPYIKNPWFIRCSRCKKVMRQRTVGEYLKDKYGE